MADDAGRINELLAETSFLYGGNAAFIEDLYARWLKATDSVEPSWRSFFASVHDRAGAAQPLAPPAWTARKAPARMRRVVRARTATVPVRSRRSRSASRKTAFPLTINR